MYSRDEEEKEEEEQFCFMAVDNEIYEVHDPNLSCSSDDDEIDDLYNELYDSVVKEKKDLKTKLAKNALLHEKVKQLGKGNHDLNMLSEILLIENQVVLNGRHKKPTMLNYQGFTNF